MQNKRIVFLTGTRADFGKLKSLIEMSQKKGFDTHVFVTGMHMQSKYGYTVEEIEKCGFKNIYKYINNNAENSMDQNLAKTIEGLSNYVREIKPDLIVIHGDRVEALAGAIVGSLNNILVAHVEGGEVSGTIDELVRHAVSKMSHTHFVSNQSAKKRLIQMGELKDNIFVIGSPDVDIMMSKNLPELEQAKNRYDINFSEYAILLFHPVTTDIDNLEQYVRNLVDAVLESKQNYIVIYPNNDLGSQIILTEYKRFDNHKHIRVFPSLRFEYFLVLLKYSRYMVGNSSAGVREAPYYGLPVVNIGDRQHNRVIHDEIIHCGYSKKEIADGIKVASKSTFTPMKLFGKGNSDQLFSEVICKEDFWKISKQKQFKDLV